MRSTIKRWCVGALIASACCAAKAAEPAAVIRLDTNSPGRIFEGIGAVSAGAPTRLLVDYPEPQRSEVLDYLFKPKFGAGFQHLKVEIGCGENSTCGSEPSHAITRSELADPKPRGYEFWLMSEARKRNPKITLDCLPWGYPSWIGDRFSKASAEWIAAFLSVAREKFGLDLDWVSAGQNEMGTKLSWIREDLRPTLDARGFKRIRLQAPDDDSEYWQIFDDMEKDPEAARLIDAVGYHYIDGREPWSIDQKAGRSTTEKAKNSGKSLWASEEWSQSGADWNGTGALFLARLINKLYAFDRTTKFEIWCPIDSIYDQIDWHDTGVMQADTPWSGHYNIWPALWVVAHTTQFAEPGWKYMDTACGQLDPKTWRGSYVTLRDPATGDWSLIICTGEKTSVRIEIGDKLKGPIRVWRSNQSEQFVSLPAPAMIKNQMTLDLYGDSVYTITTTDGQHKGANIVPPPNKPFPFPFEDNFERYKSGETPQFFSDQKGTFEVAQRPQNDGMCLAQIVPQQGILWYDNALLKPHTLFGDTNWSDCAVQADVFLSSGNVEVGGRYANRDKLGYRLLLGSDGHWQLNWQYKCLASGRLENFDSARWHRLQLLLSGDTISGFVDGNQIATVKDSSGTRGMAFLCTTYDRNLFDNVQVTPATTLKEPETR